MSETVVFPTAKHRLPDGRALAYSDTGPAQAQDVLVCLPGLLETRQTFLPVLQAARAHTGLRAISVDHCGRGDSDPLAGDQGYTMARYLDDVTHLLEELCAQGAKRLHVLGTSMGGILGFYVAANRALPVHTLMLNDVGLSFYWVSIYGLYDGMKKNMPAQTPEEMAKTWGVTLGAMLAVQSPSHFDLPYRRDWKGMKFGHLLDHYSGGVRLVYGADSGVCLADQVRDLRQQFPYARVFEVPGAKHPAPFSAQVCEFLVADLVTPSQSAASQPTQPQPTELATPVVKAPSVVAPPLEHAQAEDVPLQAPVREALDPEVAPQEGLWAWIKRKFKA